MIYRDNYALVTNTKNKYASLNDIKNIVVGVLEDDMDKINKYLSSSGDVTYKSYKDVDSMIKDIDAKAIDAIAIPKLQYLDKIIASDNLNIAYNITEYTKDYVIKLGSTSKLNNILKKYFGKWSVENFSKNFNRNLVSTYFRESKTDEKEQVKFRSKRYSYGFVLNNPFDITTKDGLRGFNHSFLSDFAKASNIEIDYKKYSSISSLVDEFSSNKLDVIFNYHAKADYNMDVYNTSSVYDEKVAVISNKNNMTVNNVSSLAGVEVLAIKGSQIEEYLKDNGVKVKGYKTIKEVISHLGKNSIAAIDYYSYDYYVRNELSDFKVLNVLQLDEEYNFVCRDISSNKTFNELFDFYLSFTDVSKTINNSYDNVLEYNHSNNLLRILLVTFSAILLVLFGVLFGKLFKRRKDNHRKLSKSDKLRYTDSMTSLKNRKYLNDNIYAWDNSDIYPQTVIIVDLNNIAYINDNFGHSEGDKVIFEGSGVLISNQLPNSEIVRTNGNEFLIFIVGQDEKAIINYIRKLHKEFKNISHGFGAAIGYSMITDEIKTIDDAVNEATADMRNNKEDM
ncbi:MAG: diguanylate cyclase [Bacilli bacterium]|nr:diguanylate cyclase [Bacilli bacterium]